MTRTTRLLLSGLLLLSTACATTPTQPLAVARYDRDMQRAAESFEEGRLREAAASYRLAVKRALHFDDPARIALAELGLGAVALELREPEQAKGHYRNADFESRRAGRDDLAAQAMLGNAEIARREGDCDAGLAGAAPLRESADRTLRLTADLLTAHCLRALGDTRAATGLLDALAAEIGSAPATLRSAWHAARAEIHLAAGALDAALDDAEKALAIDRERRFPPAIAADHRLLAEIHAAAARDTEARFHRQRAQQIFTLSGIRSASPSGNR